MLRRLNAKLSILTITIVIVFYLRVLKLKSWKRWTEETLVAIHGIFYYLIPSVILWRILYNG